MIRLTSLAAFSVTKIGKVAGESAVFTPMVGWSTTPVDMKHSYGRKETRWIIRRTLARCAGHFGRLRLGRVGLLLLILVILDRGLDSVLRQDRTVDLDWRECQFLDDGGVLDRHRLVDSLALQPLGGQAARRNGAPATERLELGGLNHPRFRVDPDLQLEDVAALRRTDEPCTDLRVGLAEGANVARVAIVLEDLFAVWHC